MEPRRLEDAADDWPQRLGSFHVDKVLKYDMDAGYVLEGVCVSKDKVAKKSYLKLYQAPLPDFGLYPKKNGTLTRQKLPKPLGQMTNLRRKGKCVYFQAYCSYKLAVRGIFGYDCSYQEVKEAFLQKKTGKKVHKKQILQESPEQWKRFHESLLGKEIVMDTGWVYDILDGKKNDEAIIFKDSDPDKGFYLLGDHRTKKTFFVPHETTDILALPTRKDLRCLRDLRAKHIPLLKAILTKGTQKLFESSPEVVSPREIQAFIHYPPTTYHLHIHFTHTTNPKTHNFRVGKAHLLEEVIQNLTISDTYYQKKTLFLLLGETHEIYKYHQMSAGKMCD